MSKPRFKHSDIKVITDPGQRNQQEKVFYKFKVIFKNGKFTNTFNNSSEIIKTELQAFIVDKFSFILKKEGLRDDIIESIICLPDLYKIPFQVLCKRIKFRCRKF